jgi:hypothetical protein
LTLAIFILLGLMFGTSLGYLALAALRAAESTDDEAAAVAVTNPPDQSLGNGWAYVSYVAREYSSEEHSRRSSLSAMKRGGSRPMS